MLSPTKDKKRIIINVKIIQFDVDNPDDVEEEEEEGKDDIFWGLLVKYSGLLPESPKEKISEIFSGFVSLNKLSVICFDKTLFLVIVVIYY